MKHQWQSEIPPPHPKPVRIWRLGPDMRPRLWQQDGRWCLAVFVSLPDDRLRWIGQSTEVKTFDEAVVWAEEQLRTRAEQPVFAAAADGDR